jgi:hypothetical protein
MLAWLDLEAFADVVFYLEVREVTPPGAGSVQVSFETSPTRDESLFAPLATLTPTAGASPTVVKALLASNAVPLARFIRWKLVGTQGGTWDMTFRAVASAGLGVTSFTPRSIAGCIWWLRADQGITLNGANVSAWADISGIGDPNRNATQATGAQQPPFNPSSTALGNRPAVTFTAGSGQVLNTGAFSIAPSDPCTVFFAGKMGTATSTRAFGALVGNNDRAFDYNAVTGAIGLTESATLTTTLTPTVAIAVVCVFNGASSKLFISAKTAVATGNVGTAPTVTGFSVGNVNSGGANTTFGGDMGEIGAYGRALSDSEAGQLIGYLGQRYSIAIGN